VQRLRAAAVLVLLLGVVGFLLWRPAQPRAAVYAFLRTRSQAQTLAGASEYKSLTGEHATVLFTDRDSTTAPLVLEAADDVYDKVAASVGFTPPGLVPVIVRPDRATLQRAFGWSSGESALGVYKSGVIQVLSPHAWLHVTGAAARRSAFVHLNPLAHELTHYVLDYATQGNYPRWFTEGLAQRVEYQITGYLWLDPAGSVRQHLYSLQEMADNFDDLANQALAYRESYLLVDYVAQRWGESALQQLVQDLAHQRSFDAAVERATGLHQTEFESAWRSWIAENADRLDAALQG